MFMIHQGLFSLVLHPSLAIIGPFLFCPFHRFWLLITLGPERRYHETMLPFFFFFYLELSDFQINRFKHYCPFKKTIGFLKGLSQIISFSVTIPCHIINILLRCRTPLSTTEDTMSIHGSKNTSPRSWTNSSYSMLERKKTYSSECGAEPVCISGISNCFCFYWPVFCLQLASVMVLWL